MKMLITLILVFCGSLQVAAQDFPSPFKYEKIDTATGTKTELYVKASEWLAKVYKSSKSVIEMSDKEAGKIVGKGVIITHTKIGAGKGDYYTSYILSVDVKDGKCRVVFSDFVTEYSDLRGYKQDLNYSLDNIDRPGNGTGSYSDKMWSDIKTDCMSRARDLTQDLLTALRSNPESW